MKAIPAKALTSQERSAFLQRHRLFREVGADVVDALAAQAVRRHVGRHTVLFAKGDPGSSLIGVLKGAVKISAVGLDGKEHLFDIMREGDMFGEIALLDGGPRSADATAMSDCELLLIDRMDFLGFLRRKPEVSLKIIEFLCERMRRVSEHVEDIIFLNSHARLAKALLHLASKAVGTPSTRTTQQEISQIVGLSREMTNRRLRDWHRAKLIRIDRGSVTVLEPVKLERIAADAAD